MTAYDWNDGCANCASIVEAAIAGKYPELRAADRAQHLRAAVSYAQSAETADVLIALVRPPINAQADILNQTVVLALLKKFPNHPDLLNKPISFLHRLTYGLGAGESGQRTTDIVADYDRVLPTSLTDIKARFDEFERSIVLLATLMPQDDVDAGRVLAYVFSGIIRIHFFQDGNGRAARFACLYLLRRWSRPMMRIPKVRNDQDWKDALKQAVDGNSHDLTQEFMRRLEGNR